MIGYINNVFDRTWKPCTPEKFFEILRSEPVKRIIREVRAGNAALKNKLPAFIFCGQVDEARYRNYLEALPTGEKAKGSRSEQFLKPTGLFMMDFDRTEGSAYRLYEKFLATMREHRIETMGFLALAHRSPRGFGLRLVLRRRPGSTIEADQRWISALMQEPIDEVCKDLSRLSYAVVQDDIFFMDNDLLFGELPVSPQITQMDTDFLNSSKEGTPPSRVILNEVKDLNTSTNTPVMSFRAERSEAKNLENINVDAHVDAHEILRHSVPLNDKKNEQNDKEKKNNLCESVKSVVKKEETLCESVKSVVKKEETSCDSVKSVVKKEAYAEDYDGIPYPVLVKALEEQLGGIPVHGARNNFIFAMACHLRYVCNDNPEWIARVLPTYGEEPGKWRRTVESACKRAQSKYVPSIVHRALKTARYRTQSESTTGTTALHGDTPPPLPAELPPLIGLLTSKVPPLMKPAVAHAVFPALGAHLGGVRFRYIDNVEHEATFMCCLLAKMSSGKSAVNKPIEYILADIVERDAENRRREQAWKDSTNQKGANKEKPKRPDDLCIQVLVSDMTNAAFVQRLSDANGKFLYTSMDEIELLDQLKTTARGNQVSQIIRLAFDCGLYGQERVGTSSVTARVRVKWNWNASSTIQKGQYYFRNALADGTLSRINFCTIAAEKGGEIPVYGTYDAAFAAALKPYIDHLNDAVGLVECPEAEDLARRLMHENAEFAHQADDEVFETLSYRANVIAYLKAMTLFVANGCRWDERFEDFVRWSERYDLWCKLRFFGEKMEEEMERENSVRSRGPKNMLEMLPDTFTREEVAAIRRAQGKDENPTSMLAVWVNRGYIRLTDNAEEYRKCDRYLKRKSAPPLQ